MPETATYICSNTECGEEWPDDNGANLCPVCGAQGRIKPPPPDGEIKIRP